MFFGKTKHSAGRRVRSQIKADPIIAADNNPNWKEGRKAESKRHKNPDTKTVVVIIKAAPVFIIVFFIDSFLDKPFESSLLKRNKKWRESSCKTSYKKNGKCNEIICPTNSRPWDWWNMVWCTLGLRMEASITLKKVGKLVRDKTILAGLSFGVETGSLVAIVGANDSGKSVLLKLLSGYENPNYGQVFVHGLDMEKNRTRLLQKMNFISPYIELPKKLTIEENLKVYGKMYGVQNLKTKIDELIEKLNLKSIQKRKAGELSSGQKNRISLAKALINDPEILLLDEPTASLDPDVGDYVRSMIESFSSSKQKTILIASHNMNEVERLCDEVMMMKNGEIIDKGKSVDLINKHGRKNLEEFFLKIVREKNEIL